MDRQEEGDRGWTTKGTEIGAHGQDRELGQMDKEDEIGKAGQGRDQDAQIKGWTDKETKIGGGCTDEGTKFKDGQTRGQPFIIHAFHKYLLSANYTPGTMPAAADSAGDKPYAFPHFLVSQSNERRPRVNKSTNKTLSACEKCSKRNGWRMCAKGWGGGQLGGAL